MNVRRVMKVMLIVFSVISGLLVTSACGASEVSEAEVEYTPSGYVITPGVIMEVQAPNITFSYKVVEDLGFEQICDEAKRIVRDWWSDDSTFVEATAIVPVMCYGDVVPQAFERDNYIFVNVAYSSLKTTMVHEYLHLQNPDGLRYADFTGNELTEMVVEAIAQSLVPDTSKTTCYCFFEACPKLVEKLDILEEAFKAKSNASQVYLSLFGPNARDIVGKLDNYASLVGYFETPEELNQFLVQILGFDSEDPFNELLSLYDEIL